MLLVDESLIIANGANRTCYQHPSNDDKCIKIPKSGHYKAQILECEYLTQLISAGLPLTQISQYHGAVDTNRGKGFVYELIRDYDNTISYSLSDYLNKLPAENSKLEVILNSLTQLKEYLKTNRIIVRNLRPYNILYKRINAHSGTAIIIDNLGHHNALPHLSDYIGYLARKDLRKKWSKFESLLNDQINSEISWSAPDVNLLKRELLN